MTITGNYLVYVAGGDMPKMVHHEWSAAWKEAERLAKKENKQAYILSVDSIVTPRQEIVTELITKVSKLDNLT